MMIYRTGLGGNVHESDPQAVIEAERLLREAGIEATCTEEVNFFPGGTPVYNRVCRPAGSLWNPEDPSGSGYISADILTSSPDPAHRRWMVEVARQNIADIERSLEESRQPGYMGDPATIAQMAQIAGRTYEQQLEFMRQVRSEMESNQSRRMSQSEQDLYRQQAEAAMRAAPGYAEYQRLSAQSARDLEAARQQAASSTSSTGQGGASGGSVADRQPGTVNLDGGRTGGSGGESGGESGGGETAGGVNMTTLLIAGAAVAVLLMMRK